MLTTEGIAAFDAIASRHVAQAGAPGLVAMIAHGEQEHVVTRGALSRDGVPVRRDTLCPRSRSFRRLLDLDEPVERLLPELADRRVLRAIDGPLDDTVCVRADAAPRLTTLQRWLDSMCPPDPAVRQR